MTRARIADYCRWAFRIIAATCATLLSVQMAWASGFNITFPTQNAVLQPGSNVTVTWTGGSATGKVNVTLIEVTPGFKVVASVASGVLNTGTAAWKLPANLSCDPKYSYQFYVEDVQRTTWIYGPVFRVACGSTASVIVTCPSPSAVKVVAPSGWTGHQPSTFKGIVGTGGTLGLACSYGVTNQGDITVRISMVCPTGTKSQVTGPDTGKCS